MMGRTKLSSFGILMFGLTACRVDSEIAEQGVYLGVPGVYDSTLRRSHVLTGFLEHSVLPVSLPAPEQEYDPELDGDSGPFNTRDLVRVVGERLFTLNQFGWLNIIELSAPDEMRMLGQVEVKTEPFQLYVQGNTVLGAFNQCDVSGEDAQSGACVVSFDISDPSRPSVQGRFSVVGQIEQAKLIDQVLYSVVRATDSVHIETSTEQDLGSLAPSGVLDVRVSPGICGVPWNLENVLAGNDRVYVLGNHHRSLVPRLLEDLDELDRAVVILSCDGLSPKEIAKELLLVEATVRTKLHRAKKKLQQRAHGALSTQKS